MWLESSRDAVINALTESKPAHIADTILANHAEGWINFFISEFAQLLKLEFVVETPFNLLQLNPIVHEYTTVYSRLVGAVGAIGVPLRAFRKDSFAEAVPEWPRNNIKISFHSHGGGKNLWHLKDSHLPGRFYFNEKGYSGWLDLSERQAEFVRSGQLDASGEMHTLFESLARHNISKYIQPQREVVDLSGHVIFFPLQVTNDTVSVHHDIPLARALELAAEVARSSRRTLLVKRHPMCTDPRIEAMLAGLENNHAVKLFSGSIHDAISACQTVLTANSSVGFTAILHQKPVIAFGASDYEICTHRARTEQELQTLLVGPTPSVDADRYARFVHIYLNEMTFQIDDATELRRRLITCVAHYVAELSPETVDSIIAENPRHNVKG